MDTVRSKKEAIISGVPQGTVLGPLMFLFYINDMPQSLDTYMPRPVVDCLLMIHCYTELCRQ